jgi:hypothetical protein
MLHVLELSRDDNAIMVTSVAWPDADKLVGLHIADGAANRFVIG